MFFPNSVSLQGSYQGLMYPGDKVVCDTIAKAIKSDDIEGIYNMFCDEGKNNNQVLGGKYYVSKNYFLYYVYYNVLFSVFGRKKDCQ